MRRLLVQFAGLALCAGALSGCSMFGDSDSNAPPANVSGANTPSAAADVSTAVHQAQLLRTSGDLSGATRILSQLMLGAPDDPRVVGEYGKLLVQQGQSGDAVQFLRRAIELQPGDWTIYSALGVAYDQQGDHPDAKLAYERALALKPGEAAVLNNFAMSRMLAGDPASARTLLLQAKASGSTDPKIDTNLALLNKMSPAAPAMAAAAHPAVASNALPAASGAPLPVVHGQVVMQPVPVDPLAGPTNHAPHRAKPARLAKAHHSARHLASNAAPAKPAKPSKGDHIPSLRMTADASKP
jgi:Flp pilus assembly protein TadD